MVVKRLRKSKDRLKLKKKKISLISSQIEEQQQQEEVCMPIVVERADDNDLMVSMKKKKKRKLIDRSFVEKKGKKSKKGDGIKKDTENDGVLHEEVDVKRKKSKKGDGIKTGTENDGVLQEEVDVKRKKSKKGDGIKKDTENDGVLQEEVDVKRKKSKKGDGIKMGTENDGVLQEEVDVKNSKVKKSGKKAKKDISQGLKETADTETDEANKVYEIPSVDDGDSKGMKKWVNEYHQKRPGLEILQQEIDDFMVAYEARKEKERKEREALAAEGGWTVVTHHKGRKKNMDAESGIAVGSVAEAAVLEKIAKKKNKEPAKDFYRFQRREAQRNEVIMLRSKFEQDKKRIQQLRAARRFRPF